MEAADLQTALRWIVGGLTLIGLLMSVRSVIDAMRGSIAPLTGMGVGVNLVFFGQFWFQVGYLLTGVPDVFHLWNTTALTALTVGTGVYITGWILDRIERRELNR